MRTLIAALAVTMAIASTVIPASAQYISPDASWTEKAFSGSGY